MQKSKQNVKHKAFIFELGFASLPLKRSSSRVRIVLKRLEASLGGIFDL